MDYDLDLRGKRALVTGAGVRVGAAIAARLPSLRLQASVGVGAQSFADLLDRQLAQVVSNHVVENDGLGTTHENDRLVVRATSQPVGRLSTRTIGVELEDRVRDPRIGLVNFKGVESSEGTLDATHTPTISDQGMVDADLARRTGKDP